MNFKKQNPLFCSMLDKIFKTADFVRWLARQLGILLTKLPMYLQFSQTQNYSESRVWVTLSLDTQQHVYDTQTKNSINSTDGRNGRNIIQITKNNSFTSFGQFQNNDIVNEEKRNKCRHVYFYANKIIVTSTVSSIQWHLVDAGVNVSTGKVMSLCLSKLCLKWLMWLMWNWFLQMDLLINR